MCIVLISRMLLKTNFLRLSISHYLSKCLNIFFSERYSLTGVSEKLTSQLSSVHVCNATLFITLFNHLKLNCLWVYLSSVSLLETI